MKVCIVGASGKLGQYMVQHSLDRGYEVVGVCREQSVDKLAAYEDRITVFSGSDERPGRHQARGRGMRRRARRAGPPRRAPLRVGNGAGGARLRAARRAARVLVRVAHHPRRAGRVFLEAQERSSRIGGRLARLARFADLDDQVEACRRVFESDTRWTVVRGSDLEEGESQGLPVWSRHVGDPILESNLTRRVDFALFMVEALENDELIHEAPAIVGCRTPSALAHAGKTHDSVRTRAAHLPRAEGHRRAEPIPPGCGGTGSDDSLAPEPITARADPTHRAPGIAQPDAGGWRAHEAPPVPPPGTVRRGQGPR